MAQCVSWQLKVKIPPFQPLVNMTWSPILCPHCWNDVTTQPSGRAQNQWSNRTCLQWQFCNQMAADVKEKDNALAWVKAGKDAAALYEKRRWIAAPYPGEMVPPPPVSPKRRSASVMLRSGSTDRRGRTRTVTSPTVGQLAQQVSFTEAH